MICQMNGTACVKSKGAKKSSARQDEGVSSGGM